MDTPEPPLVVAPDPPRSQMWAEVAVVVAVGVLPGFLASVQSIFRGYGELPFLDDAIGLIVHSLPVVAVVAFIIWRSGQPLAHFGIRRLMPRADLILAALIVLAVYLASYIAWGLIAITPGNSAIFRYDQVIQAFFDTPSGPGEHVLLIIMSLVNGGTEQLVICAFLFTRLERLLASTARALLACTALFASYHIYQGPSATIIIGATGIVLIGAFALCRRYWPVALAHAALDVLAYMQMS